MSNKDPSTPRVVEVSVTEQFKRDFALLHKATKLDVHPKILKPATRIPLQPNHTEIPTHIEPRTIRPMW